MKVAVIGYSGSGKSTLAGKLGEIYDCPVLYLDKIQFEENWVERDENIAKSMVFKFLEENHEWVIDGNYTKFYRERRLEEADLIIFMNFSRITCLFQAYRRYFTYKGKTRESMADKCEEKIDFEFVKWILLDQRSKEKKKEFIQTVNKYYSKTIVLKSRKETELFIKNLQLKNIN